MKNESAFSREIRKALEAKYGDKICVEKIVQNGMMKKGLPDLIGCLSGMMIGIESKLIKTLPQRPDSIACPKNTFTKDQIDTIKKINKAGGKAFGLVCIPCYSNIAIIVEEADLEQFSAMTLRELSMYISAKGPRVLTKNRAEWDLANLEKFILIG
jgi:penicillin-binding protein-related factor A (putative recombinase)